MRSYRCLFLMLALMLAGGTLVRAAEVPHESQQRGTTRLVSFGLAGGFLGFSIGALFGASYGNDPERELAGVEAAFFAGSALGALGLGIGVHAANDALGSGLLVVAASAGIGAAGVASAFAANEGSILLLTVPAQMAGAILVERATAKRSLARRADAPTVSLGAWRSPDGPPGLALRCRF